MSQPPLFGFPGPDDLDLVGEEVEPSRDGRPVPGANEAERGKAETTRRVLLGVSGALLLALLIPQVLLAWTMTPEEYAPLASVFSTITTLLAATCAAAGLYYWTHPD